ncbi:MAG: DNA replication and repair protein RecF [Puia sp.]|nr:DNA replication and repair protein RecF [Puia sp.]
MTEYWGLLRLKDISLVQFKNYGKAAFEFRERVIGLSGRNGIGKTNLLDAIYYLCVTKSYFAKSDQQNVHHGHAGFRIEGHFEKNGADFRAICILRETGKKEFSLNGEVYERFSAHVGRFPCVIIAPDDIRIISEGSEERRRFLDALCSQLNPKYLQSLIEYNRILQQRNGFLKSVSEMKTKDLSLLDVYDSQLAGPGDYLFTQRASFLQKMLPLVRQLYTGIAGGEEPIELAYDSQLHETAFPALLSGFRSRDLLLQRTSGGIHKDDIEIRFREQSFKNIASQGQRKSLLFALKLAEYEMLKEAKGFPPLMLLDDVFEKLDEQRMHNLLDRVCIHNKGQIFITDTHPGRIERQLDHLSIPCQVVQL